MPDKRQQSQSEKLDIAIAFIISIALFFAPPAISERLNPVFAFLAIAIERLRKTSED